MGERIPLPHMLGWYGVLEEDELAPGELKRARYFGRELVIWRGEDGDPHVVDAYCPHLGAHLGVGGRVEGDTLVCPFHAWRYDGSGQCVEIPYARRIPPKARLGSWPVVRRNGLVFAWYHPDGAPPAWDIPEIPEWGDAAWTAPQARSFEVHSHAQEMAENTVDAVHFHFVHGTPHIPDMKAEIQGHRLHAYQGLTFTTPAGEKKGRVDIDVHGPGFGVTRFQGVVDTLLMITGIPLDDEHHRTTIRFQVRKIDGDEAATAGVAKAFIDEISRQYTQDIPIWENKKYLEKPLLCDGDGPIGLIRKYYAQFRPEPSGRARGESAA